MKSGYWDLQLESFRLAPWASRRRCDLLELLKARVVVCSYNDHVRPLSPEPIGWIQHHQLYSGLGADIVMESIIRFDRRSMSAMAILRQLSLSSIALCSGNLTLHLSCSTLHYRKPAPLAVFTGAA
jgi:hypothetical protein